MTARLDALLDTQRASLSSRDTTTWDAKIKTILASCHPKQRAFVLDPAARSAALTARNCGKTTGARARLAKTAMERRRARCLFIATTRGQASDFAWNPLKSVFEKLGVEARYNETRLQATLQRTGSMIQVVGADDTREADKLRGVDWDDVVIDECASYPPLLLETLVHRVIGPRLRGRLALIGTPGARLDGLFYDVTRPGGLSRAYEDRDADWGGWSSHHWTLADGAPTIRAMADAWSIALQEKERNEWDDDHPVWCREYLGRWARDDTENIYRYRPHDDAGQPFNQWDPERDPATGIARLPAGGDWQYVYALDMGHADPMGLNIFAFDPNFDRKLRHVYCFEQKGMYARSIAELLLGPDLDTDNPGGLFGATGWPSAAVADLAGLGGAVLDELANVYGVRFEAAEKKSKHDAIELCNGDLVDGRILVLRKSHLEEQLLSLQWWPDKTGTLRENKAQANHSADCLVYGRRAVSNQLAGPAHEPDPATASPAVPREPASRKVRDGHDMDQAFAKTGGEDDFRSVLGDDAGYFQDPYWG